MLRVDHLRRFHRRSQGQKKKTPKLTCFGVFFDSDFLATVDIIKRVVSPLKAGELSFACRL